MLEELVVQNIW